MSAPPPNAYAPGTPLTVGSHNITIIKYISAGGFAHVYTCNVDPPFHGSSTACLKRVVVPNKWQLNLLRQEVDAMKRLRGNPTIVSYIDSHASRLNPPTSTSTQQQQQYEVFLLMEYCSRNGLIDFMNTRLTHRLSEPEILAIMHDVIIGVVMCHHLQPPLIHRDIKIENVLIDEKGTYKLCDFGSAVGYATIPKNPQELLLFHDEIMQHTTPQYRAPEMIDLSKGFPIDDKADIWALGCLLYKLCYYTTPFELPNQTSLRDLEVLILNCNATLQFPPDPPGQHYSSRLKNIIKCCLRGDPRRRPSGIQLLEEICAMRGEKKIPNVIPHTVKTHHHSNKTEDARTHHSHKTVHQSEDAPSLPSRNPVVTMRTSKPPDPFASIDKSKLLQNPSSEKRTNKTSSRPLSLYEDKAKSTTNLKDFIQKQLNESNDDLTLYSSYEDKEGTLEFLRSREMAQSKHLSLAQNTGGSIKQSIKNGLRKISTGGGSISSAQNTGNNNIGSHRRTDPSNINTRSDTGNNNFDSHHRRSSMTSLKQLWTGSRKTSGHEEHRKSRSSSEEHRKISPEATTPSVKKLSIQRRTAMLLNNQDTTETQKTARGYGRYTESDQDDIAAINKTYSSSPEPTSAPKASPVPTSYKNQKHLQPPKVPSSLSSKKSTKGSNTPKIPSSLSLSHTYSSSSLSAVPVSSGGIKASASSPLPKTARTPLVTLGTSASVLNKKPPPKPKKPVYLKSPSKEIIDGRRLSNSSEISIPDVDDLEKQFSKRFPSYV